MLKRLQTCGITIAHSLECASTCHFESQLVVRLWNQGAFSICQRDGDKGEVIAIERGKRGYLVTDNECAPSLARKAADLLNRKLGVSKAQEAAMSAGSMFGWDTPAADPKNYDAEGKAVKPKQRERGDAR